MNWKNLALLFLLLCVAGCGGNDALDSAAKEAGLTRNKFSSMVKLYQDMGPMGASLGIGQFRSYITDWEERVANGSWESMLQDGTYTNLVADTYTGDPKDYAEFRIAELQTALKQMETVSRYMTDNDLWK